MSNTPTSSSSAGSPGAAVEIKVPAQGAYVSMLRTTTAALAARLQFTMEDVEDLRIAVGEAVAMALGHATPESQLRCAFNLSPTQVEVIVSVPVVADAFPEYDSFTWTVLSALATEATVSTDDGEFVVRLLVDSSLSGADA